MNAQKARHLVVDGSNIATEGRTAPSLVQLDEAVAAVARQGFHPITVIVDATFPRRIDKSEAAEFEKRVLEGEIVTPPAGVVGRGDAFILQVAVEADAVVLSNDSFQEFHGEHEWLLSEEGRLLGGKPVPNVGWVFALRSPVRGEVSQQAVRAAKRAKRSSDETTASKKSAKKEPSSRRSRTKRSSGSEADRSTDGPNTRSEVPSPSEQSSTPAKRRSSRRRRKGETPPPADAAAADAASDDEKAPNVPHLNDVEQFMTFVRNYSIGDTLEGVVERYSSHGCYLRAATAQCYLPSKAMGDPPPNRARDVVSRGQTVRVKVESLDAERRGINVSLVALLPEAGTSDRDQSTPSTHSRSDTTMATPKKATRKRPAKKAPAKRTTKKAPAKKAPAKRTTKKAPAKKTPATRTTKKAPARKAPARKTAAKRTTKKAPARKTAAKRTTKKA